MDARRKVGRAHDLIGSLDGSVRFAVDVCLIAAAFCLRVFTVCDCYAAHGVDLTAKFARQEASNGSTPWGPLDQTMAFIYYEGGSVQRDIARLWRKLRGLFRARHPRG